MAGKSILADGINLYKKGDYAGSLAFFLALPEDSPVDNIELAYYIGLCYVKLQRNDDALLYLEQVVTAGTDMNRVLQCRYLLAVMYALSGRKKLAKYELEKLLETGYKPSSVYSSLAYVAWQQDSVEESINLYKKSLELDSENPTALNGLGYVLAYEERDLTQALSYCRKALNLAPQSAACMDSIGFVYIKLGLKKDAIKYLTQAHEMLPENKEIIEHLEIAQAE